MGSETDNKEYEASCDSFAYRLIADRVSKYNFPTVFGFPNGHILDNRPLIIGSEVSIRLEDVINVKF